MKVTKELYEELYEPNIYFDIWRDSDITLHF